jgi:hypothetical protein
MSVVIGLWPQCVCNVMNWRLYKSKRYGNHIERECGGNGSYPIHGPLMLPIQGLFRND